MPATTANPLRFIGLARVLAGTWFVASGLVRLIETRFLEHQLVRLIRGDLGATDAPIRALLELLLAPTLTVLGVIMIARGARWMRRLPVQGPTPLSADEVRAVLVEHRLPAYEDVTVRQPWPISRWIDTELDRMAGWRRDLFARAMRVLRTALLLAVALAATWFLLSVVPETAPLGPPPLRFIFLYPIPAAYWAALTALLLGSAWPRTEALTLEATVEDRGTEPFRESLPTFLGREPAVLGTALAVVGVATQCAIVSWWTLDTISYPSLATSIVRHAGTIVGGVLFYVTGARMIAGGSELLRRVQYDSVVVLLEGATADGIVHGAEIRTESRDPDGERRVISAVGSAHAREAALELLAGTRPAPPPVRHTC